SLAFAHRQCDSQSVETPRRVCLARTGPKLRPPGLYEQHRLPVKEIVSVWRRSRENMPRGRYCEAGDFVAGEMRGTNARPIPAPYRHPRTKTWVGAQGWLAHARHAAVAKRR